MRLLLVALLAFAFLAPEIGAVQSVTAGSRRVGDSTPAAAKAARCTPVPGGQVIAGALDTAKTKKVAAAAASVTGGGRCTPGMAMSPEQMKQMQAQIGAMKGNGDAQATALMQAMQARMAQMARGDGAMAMSPEQLKQLGDQMAAMQGNGKAQPPAAMQVQMDQAIAGSDRMPTGAMAMPPGEMGMSLGAMGMSGRRVGKALQVSSDLPGDMKKGKTVIRNIDWIPGAGTVSPAGTVGFRKAMAQVAAAMKQAGGSYRIDLYMDQQSGNIVVRTLGPQRLAAVRASLLEGGAPPGADGPQIGHSMKDGDPRLEIVRLK